MVPFYPWQSEASLEPNGASAYVLLNGSPLSARHERHMHVRKGLPIVVADGAANLLKEAIPDLVPTFIVGDFDSIDPEVLEHYRIRGTEIVHRPSQESCDFTKAMAVALAHRDSQSKPVVVLGGHPQAGRMDQFFGNIQELCSRAEQGYDVWWIGDQTATMVLSAGAHRIAVNASLEGPMCGLVPIAGLVARVTTRGLRWDLTDQELKFGHLGLVSSSNEIMEPVVVIETSGTILWTCDIKL